MRRVNVLACALVGVFGLSSCVTHDWTAKAVSGRVIDADSGKPLSGVNVYRMIEGKSVLITTTDSAEHFSVAPSGRIYLVIPMGDAFYGASLIFRAAGYKEHQLDCSTMTGEVGGWNAPSLAPTTVRLRKKV
jgi:hypothetical protein